MFRTNWCFSKKMPQMREGSNSVALIAMSLRSCSNWQSLLHLYLRHLLAALADCLHLVFANQLFTSFRSQLFFSFIRFVLRSLDFSDSTSKWCSWLAGSVLVSHCFCCFDFDLHLQWWYLSEYCRHSNSAALTLTLPQLSVRTAERLCSSALLPEIFQLGSCP